LEVFGAVQGGLVPLLDNICLHLPTIRGPMSLYPSS
jgi:hypothetical protein